MHPFEGLKHLATSWGGALLNDALLGTARGVAGGAAERAGEALARRILEMDRDKVSKFLDNDLWKEGGEYQRAAEHLLEGQKLRQQRAPRPYGNLKRFKPGDEDKYMFALARFFRLFCPPRPEPPQPFADAQAKQQEQQGRQRQQRGPSPQVFQLLWNQYLKDLKNWKRDRNTRMKERLDFFRDLGLKDPADLEAYLESVHDDKFQQWFALPFFEMAEATRASLKAAKKVGRKAKSATKTGWNETGHAVEFATRPLDDLNARLEQRARQKGRI